MAPLHFASTVQLSATLRRREISSRELLELFVGRVARDRQAVNAVVALDLDRAFERVDAADNATARGTFWGPLHGVPMTVKDAFETAGMITTSGAPSLRDHVPAVDAVSVKRLRDAGAVIFGKTNLPLFARDVQTYNEVYGTTRNPWDLDLAVGGSSGGSAAALAAGFTGFELGSDLAGSLRNPAHFCGVYAFKPTHGVIPCRGHIPALPGAIAEPDVTSPGPMGRSVADLAVGLDVLAGPAPERALAWRLALPPPRATDIDAMRVAAWIDDPAAPIGSAVRTVIAATLDTLRSAGMSIDENARPGPTLSELFELWTTLIFPRLASSIDEATWELACARERRPEDDDSQPGWPLRAFATRHRDWLAANERRHRYLAAFSQYFDNHDALLTPVAAVPAFPHDHDGTLSTRTFEVDGERRHHTEIFVWPSAFGGIWLPAATLPIGFTDHGLPVGLQVVGSYLGDKTVLAVAAAIEQVVGGFTPPPAWSTPATP
jgi:amidase